MNYLYGKLNKELEYVKYSGEDTDTVNITVDNTDNIIKADIVRTPKTLTIHNNIYDSYDSFNGAYDTLIELPNYEIEQEDFPEGSLLIYDFKLNGEVISKIRIPYDKDIFNIELDVCVEDDNPLGGLHVGDPYLKITIEDGHGSSTYKYISLASLVYKAGDSIKIENNIISVDLDNGKLSEQVQKLNTHIEDKNNPHQVTQQQVGIYTYKNIEANFEENQGNESYPCAADIELEAIKDDTQIPNIYFSKEQVDSGKYAPYCETYYRENNIGEIINPISVGDNLGGAGFFVTDDQPDFSLLDWSNAKEWVDFGFKDISGDIGNTIIETDYRSPKYITLISSKSDPTVTESNNTLRVCYFEQEFRAQLSDSYEWYFPAETYAIIMPGYYQFILYASKESWDPYGNMNVGGYKGIGWGGTFYDATNKKFVDSGDNASDITYILYNTINYVDSQQDIWGKWITKDKHYIQTQDEINLKENESTSIIYLYLPSNDEGISKLVHELETLDWDNPDKSGTNPYLGDYKIINFFTVSDSIGTSRPYCVYQFKIEYEDHSQYQIAYAIGFENTDSFNWVSWGGTPSSALDFDSIVTISNIQHQEIWGPYISNCNRSIKKLSENDIIDKFIFDVSWEWNFYYNVFDRLNWNSPDETITESDYLIKKIHIFKYGDKYASICKQIGVSSSEVRRYFIQLYAYWGEYTAYLNNNKYSQYWDDFEYTPDSPVTITEIKHQEIWGSAIGKKAEIKEAGYYLKAYSKEAGKITIPAITLQ